MTKIPQIIFGPRGSSELGVFASPSGVDARTASADQLLLNLSGALPQIALRGVAAPPFPQTIVHGLPYAALVFPNLISTGLLGGGFGYVRPFDNTWGPWTNSQITSQVGQIVIQQSGSGPALSEHFMVINRPLPS